MKIDITSAASVHAAFDRTEPDAVILLAAVSDIDQCERQPELAEAVNVCGAAHVVQACRRTKARLIFTSSAAVFDGTRHGYTECDPPTPVSVYGGTKARAETTDCRGAAGGCYPTAGAWVGFAEGAGTNAMLNKFAARLRAGETVSLPDFEYRNPIDAATLSGLMLELLGGTGAAGIFHVGATESISRFELGVRLAETNGLLPSIGRASDANRCPGGRRAVWITFSLRTDCRGVPDARSQVATKS